MKRNSSTVLAALILFGVAATQAAAQPYQRYTGRSTGARDMSKYLAPVSDCIAGFTRQQNAEGSYLCVSAPPRCPRGFGIQQVPAGRPDFSTQSSATYNGRWFQYQCGAEGSNTPPR